MRVVFLFLFLFLFLIQSSTAAVSMNAVCVYNDNPQKTLQDRWLEHFNLTTHYEIASLTKIFTAYWALKTLGPQFRFQTHIYIQQYDNNKIHLHIAGAKDPYFGRNDIYFLISELNKMGISRIDRVTFDENFKLNWNVTYYPSYPARMRSYLPSILQIKNELKEVLHDKKPNMNLYNNLKAFSSVQLGLEMQNNPDLFVEEIGFLSQADFSAFSGPSTQFTLQSAPLISYIKEMLSWSHNYVADMVFMGLGNSSFLNLDEEQAKANSAIKLKTFLVNNLKMKATDIELYNGSGDAEYLNTGKKYNKSSCEMILRGLGALRSELQINGLSLENAMAVSGIDRGTLFSRYQDMINLFIGKSGAVNVAANLTGMIPTNNGNVLFAFLYKTDSPLDWNQARSYIKKQIKKVLSDSNGSQPINYLIPRQLENDFVPFDNQSWVKEASLSPVASLTLPK